MFKSIAYFFRHYVLMMPWTDENGDVWIFCPVCLAWEHEDEWHA
jgi:hypothetical protein